MNFKCGQCNIEVTNESELYSHVEKENTVKLFCDDCEFTAFSVKDNKTHENDQRGVKELYSCSQCKLN